MTSRGQCPRGGACECPRVGAFFKLMTSRGQCPRGGVRLVFHPSKFRPPPHLAGWLRACTCVIDSLYSGGSTGGLGGHNPPPPGWSPIFFVSIQFQLNRPPSPQPAFTPLECHPPPVGIHFFFSFSIQLQLTSLIASGFDIHLCWLLGHVGIRGNERADRAAKTARKPPSDFKPISRKHITAMLQSTWDESPLNKLHEIAPIVNEPRTHLSTRRGQSVFNRCRIGHSRLMHEFLLKGEPPPECIPCNCPLTIKRFYQVPSLQDLFKT